MTPYYITTPIYYVNDRPHIGHCYTTVLADVAARFQRLIRGQREQVFFLTGTDEHADKVVTSAAEHGVGPQEWADRNAAEFRRAFALMGCAPDDFIRTTEPRHKDKVPGYIRELVRRGDIYKGEYTGWYDEGQEEYVPENTARENDFKSAISTKPLVKRTEPCYFFRLGKYQEQLRAHIEAHPSFVMPEARRNEVLGRLRPPAVLNDVPVSRPVTADPATQWGVRMPDDPANRVYVWIDALFNYCTAVDTPQRKHLWPATVHLIGKDILWFHAVIWPAMLMALDVPLPGTIYGHGWWVSEGQKMSKSLGNFIDLERMVAYANRYSLDALRWFLVTQGPLGGVDADFSHAKFVEVYNADLANGIGNCASRVGNMIEKYFGGDLPDAEGISRWWIPGTPSTTAVVQEVKPGTFRPLREGDAGAASAQGIVTFDWCRDTGRFASGAATAMDSFDLASALTFGANLVRSIDSFISTLQPFKLAKTTDTHPATKQELGAILHNCAEALRIASLLLSPAMPTKMAALWKNWNCAPPPGVPLAELARFGGPHALKPGQKIAKGEALFMRADPAEPPPS